MSLLNLRALAITHSKALNSKALFSTSTLFNKSQAKDVKEVQKVAHIPEIELAEQAPEGISEEVYSLYKTAVLRTKPLVSKRAQPSTAIINRFLTSIKSTSELQLAPEVIERWHRKQINFDGIVSRFPFYLSEKLDAPEIGYQLLADRHRYGLFPTTREFNRVLKAFVGQTPSSEDVEASTAWVEKILMTYGLIPFYGQAPNQDTADILMPALLNSPLAEDWFPRFYKIAHELKASGIVLPEEVSLKIAEMVTKFGRPTYGEKMIAP